MTRITTRANNNINHKEMTRWLFAQITLIGSSDFDDKIYKKRYFMHYICKTHYLVDSSWNKEKDVLEQKKPVLIEDLNHHGQVSPCHSRLSLKNIPDKETNITYLDFCWFAYSGGVWADYVCQLENLDAKTHVRQTKMMFYELVQGWDHVFDLMTHTPWTMTFPEFKNIWTNS